LGFIDFFIMGFLGTIRAYLDFSSLADMGRGIAQCFGIKLLTNFRPILLIKSPAEFWKRWNVGLSEWIRDNIVFNLSLSWGKVISPILIVFVTFFLMGIWHGTSWNWILFGFVNGIIIALTLYLNSKMPKNLGYFLKIILIILTINLVSINGILQNKSAFKILELYNGQFFSTADWGQLLNFFISWKFQLTGTFLYLLSDSFLDHHQVLAGDSKKFLKYRSIYLALAIGVFLYMSMNLKFSIYAFQLPIYFRF
ncbi:MAG: hypothetical protein K2Q18_12695, partial [Bdellovibrionales bacterium]|nr:hypothetical protein [Bdellovibrionales bacterium]